MQVLILSGNALSGPLPNAYTRLNTLRALDLSSNSFDGQLPALWVSMRQLVFLGVSNNTLVSPLPETLRFMAGEGYGLRCLVLSGNAGMNRTELAEVKKAMEVSRRVTVVTGSGSRTCDISVLDQ
jgi:hypothetical protein